MTIISNKYCAIANPGRIRNSILRQGIKNSGKKFAFPEMGSQKNL